MGYLALPEGEGTFPAVLMVHEWWGLNEEITHMADRLAEEGYIVLAMDTYRGQVTSQVPRAIFLRVTMPEAQIDQDMQSAYEYLISLPQVDAERIGGIGFCYGGGVILRHATQNRIDMGNYSIETFCQMVGFDTLELSTGVRFEECMEIRRRWGKDQVRKA